MKKGVGIELNKRHLSTKQFMFYLVTKTLTLVVLSDMLNSTGSWHARRMESIEWKILS
jgi:hypothetical protein